MHKLLVVVDMQNDFVTGSLAVNDVDKIIPNIVKKIKYFDGHGILVTRDTHDENYLSTYEGKHLPIKHCIKDTEGWQIQKDIRDSLDEYIKMGLVRFINKSSFGTDAICDYIKTYNYDTVEFVGVCTDICVISNAIAVRNNCPEVNVIIQSMCCAGTTDELHKAALDVMTSCQIKVI